MHPVSSKFLFEAAPLRVFAILAVVALHASAVRVEHFPDVQSVNWWGANVIDSLCRWAVPVFIMHSGALNLDPARNYPLLKFYTKRFSRVVVPLIVWACFYYWWSAYSYRMAIDWDFIKTSLYSGLSYNHLYFLIIIIGLYMVTPAIKWLTKSLPEWALWVLALGLLYYTATGYFFSHVSMNAFTRFSPYLLFYLLGYLFRSANFSRAWSGFFLCVYFAASLPIIYITGISAQVYGLDDYRTFSMYDHFNMLVIVQAVSVYLLIKCMFSQGLESRLSRFLTWAAPASFGVYLIHVIFLDIITSYTAEFWGGYVLIAIGLEVVSVFFLSTFIVKLILKAPYLRVVVGS